MTDEEKVEEYAGKKCANCIRYYCKKQNKKGGSIDCCNEYLFQRKHFLAGLTEGKPKWHDLREDPTDLPKENGHYWCKWNDGSYGFHLKHHVEHHFHNYGFGAYVIAWCDLPKFEE